MTTANAPAPPTLDREPRVLLAHGGGGELMNQLIREHFLPALHNDRLAPLTDGAVLPRVDGDVVLTTDSFVVTPLEFPGGDVGRLAVCGTVNDLAVMGAEPLALSLGLIIEEGLPLALLDRICASIAAAADEAGVRVVTGDTKVIERRPRPVAGNDTPDVFINTAGLGRLRRDARLDVARVEPSDVVFLNGTIADHGLAIMSLRNGLEFDCPLRSDAAPLNRLVADLLASGADLKFLRDATRGGVAGVLADICDARGLTLEIDESRIPIHPAARHAAEMLGLDPLNVANEGKLVGVAAAADADRILQTMRQNPLGRHAACIGTVSDAQPPLVELVTRAGGRRIVRRPYGEDLPRIC